MESQSELFYDDLRYADIGYYYSETIYCLSNDPRLWIRSKRMNMCFIHFYFKMRCIDVSVIHLSLYNYMKEF